jgi:hypothetical protein
VLGIVAIFGCSNCGRPHLKFSKLEERKKGRNDNETIRR